MEQVITLEILDRGGRVKERIRLNGLPVTVGRAYSCDVIINDRYICPEHLTIAPGEDGAVVVKDNSSLNGLFTVAPAEQVQEITIDSDTRLRIGHTTLRFATTETQIPPTIVDPWISKNWRKTIALGRTALTAMVITYSVLLSHKFLAAYHTAYSQKFLSEAIILSLIQLLFLIPWAGVWALLSRVIVQRSFFSAHCSIACFGILGIYGMLQLSDYVEFAFSAGTAFRMASSFVTLLVVVMVFYVHLTYATNTRPRRLRLILSGIYITLVALISVHHISTRNDFTEKLHYSHVVKPPAFKISGSYSLDEFLKEAGELKEGVDELRIKD